MINAIKELNKAYEYKKAIRKLIFQEKGYYIFKNFLSSYELKLMRLFWQDTIKLKKRFSISLNPKEGNKYSTISKKPYIIEGSLYNSYCTSIDNLPIDELTHEFALIAIMIRNIISEKSIYNNVISSNWITKYTVIKIKTSGEIFPLHNDWMKDEPLHPSGPHVFDPSKLQMTLPLTTKGQHYSNGGHYFMINNKKIFFEDIGVNPGDLILWRYGIPHGVKDLSYEKDHIGLINIYFPNNFYKER